MDKIRVYGGCQLSGEVEISSAKNAVLPIIAASILSKEKVTINEVPLLKDVTVICNILKSLNCKISLGNDELIIDSSTLTQSQPDNTLVRKMRASCLLMGPLLARFGYFKISLPGGCSIGTRPIDLHMKGLSALGAEINIGHGYVEAKADKLIGDEIYLDFPSVGATENILMAAVLAEGRTIIQNAAEEPEIQDLANFLISMGANIKGAGTDTIVVTGVDELHGTMYKPIYDRIEAGTFMIAAAITRSKIKIKDINEVYLKPIIAKLIEVGVMMEIQKDGIIVDGRQNLEAIDLKTMPYPGFPTDMQAQMMALLCTVRGTSIITETIFENRFMHVSELKRLGANIKVDGRIAAVQGIDKLTGTDVKATDLRAGAAMILAGLAAQGYTTIHDVYHIDRGYISIEKKFKKLGANIIRI